MNMGINQLDEISDKMELELLKPREIPRIVGLLEDIKTFGISEKMVITLINDRTRFGKGNIKKVLDTIYQLHEEMIG